MHVMIVQRIKLLEIFFVLYGICILRLLMTMTNSLFD